MPYSRRAAIYEVEYVETRDVEFVRSLIRPGHSRVLEIPCGAGRLSRRISDLARRLTLVDLEPEMAARACRAAAATPGAGEIAATAADMRSLALAEDFDLALVPREALQLLPPAQGATALAAVGRHIVPGGRMLVDLAAFATTTHDPPDPDYYDPARPDGAWRQDWVRKVDAATRLSRWSAQRHEPDGSAISFTLRYEVDRGTHARETWQSEMTLHRYSQSWLADNTPAGWVLETLYGGYGGAAWTPCSSRAIAVFHKTAPGIH